MIEKEAAKNRFDTIMRDMSYISTSSAVGIRGGIGNKVLAQLGKETNEEIKKIMEEQKQLIEKLVEHLFDVGWIVNYDYIQRKKEENGELREDDVDIEVMVSGKYKNEYHLISKCKKYTIKIKKDEVNFWQKEPKWILLSSQKIKDVELTQTGVKVGVLKIELDSEGEN